MTWYWIIGAIYSVCSWATLPDATNALHFGLRVLTVLFIVPTWPLWIVLDVLVFYGGFAKELEK